MAAAIAMANISRGRRRRAASWSTDARRRDDAAQCEDRECTRRTRSTAPTSSFAATRRAQTSRPAHGFGSCCLNIVGAKYTFSGAPTHQMTPWMGRNAVEAVVQFFNNIDASRISIRPEARIPGRDPRGRHGAERGARSRGCRLLHPLSDEVYLQQVVEFVDNAAKAAALSTGTKGEDRSLRHGSRRHRAGDAGGGRVSVHEELRRDGINPEPGKPQGYEETGSVSRDIPGVGFSAQSSTWSNHTYEMDADNLKEIGHKGFSVDAEAMAAVLFDFATHPEYRDAVKKEFDGIKGLFGEYQAALKKTYTIPNVPDPK